MAKTPRLKRKLRQSRRADRAAPEYRAVTLGDGGDQWGVVDDRGCIVFRGDARVAAMIASRLTRPAR